MQRLSPPHNDRRESQTSSTVVHLRTAYQSLATALLALRQANKTSHTEMAAERHEFIDQHLQTMIECIQDAKKAIAVLGEWTELQARL